MFHGSGQVPFSESQINILITQSLLCNGNIAEKANSSLYEWLIINIKN